MAGRVQTRGACAYCGREMAHGRMGKHLSACETRRAVIAAADAERNAGDAVPLIHLQVRDGWRGDFWLHLEMKGSATLRQLDTYLRAIWLDCCGHRSRFSIGGWRGEQVGMGRTAAQVFLAGVEVTHTYDFGNESFTLVRAVEAREGHATTPHPIALMARNAAPALPCRECSRPATHICKQCLYETGVVGTLCDAHTEAHPHEEYPRPLVNSPRAGMCGYEGPGEPPY